MTEELEQKIREACMEKGFNVQTTEDIIKYCIGYKSVLKNDAINDEVLLKQILENLNGNIVKTNLSRNPKGKKSCNGRYSITNGIIEIDEDLDGIQRDITIFHEIGHARRRFKKDNKMLTGAMTCTENGEVIGTALSDGMETFFEEMYKKHLDGEETDWEIKNFVLDGAEGVNGYDTSITYTKQLIYLIGKEMILQYDRNPESFVDYVKKYIREKIYYTSSETPKKIRESIDKKFDKIMRIMDEIDILSTGKVYGDNPSAMQKIELGQIDRSREIEDIISSYISIKVQSTIPKNIDELYEKFRYLSEFKTLLINPERVNFSGYIKSAISDLSERSGISEKEIIEQLEERINAKDDKQKHTQRIKVFEKSTLDSVKRRYQISNALNNANGKDIIEIIKELNCISDTNPEELEELFEAFSGDPFQWMSFSWEQKRNFKYMVQALSIAELQQKKLCDLNIKTYEIGRENDEFALKKFLMLRRLFGNDNINFELTSNEDLASAYTVILADGNLLEVIRQINGNCENLQVLCMHDARNVYTSSERKREFEDFGIEQADRERFNSNLIQTAKKIEDENKSEILIVEEDIVDGKFIGIDLTTGKLYFINADKCKYESLLPEYSYPDDEDDEIFFTLDEIDGADLEDYELNDEELELE